MTGKVESEVEDVTCGEPRCNHCGRGSSSRVEEGMRLGRLPEGVFEGAIVDCAGGDDVTGTECECR